jgi:CRP-like cAMP-binding protein
MASSLEEENYIGQLKLKFESYSPISDSSWKLLKELITFKTIEQNEALLRNGQTAKNIYFVCKGALSAYFTDSNGNVYTKNIFLESDFAGSTVSYLLKKPSNFTLEALESTILISINYDAYRNLIDTNEDLQKFYVFYLEKNWVIAKEEREISIVMENATDRYLKLLEKHPTINTRIQQLHIASHLGITPTQLSRIRKKIK